MKAEVRSVKKMYLFKNKIHEKMDILSIQNTAKGSSSSMEHLLSILKCLYHSWGFYVFIIFGSLR